MLILWRRSPIQYVLLVGYATYSRNLAQTIKEARINLSTGLPGL